MKSDKIAKFMELGGQQIAQSLTTGDADRRKLGAQLLLSEVLEYVIKGLGVQPEINGVRVTDPEKVNYIPVNDPSKLEMLDGLADTAYTMYWNAVAFGLPLEEAFELVCDNNLDKFVKLSNWQEGARPLEREEWDCNLNVEWPPEVVEVAVLKVSDNFYAVGKDERGKVRKPSTYSSVDLKPLIA